MKAVNTLPLWIVPALASLLLAIGGWSFFYIALAACIAAGVWSLRPLPEVGACTKTDQPHLNQTEWD